MVQGVEALRARFAKVVPRIEAALKQELEKAAREIVRQMDSVKPLPEIEIGWTWGAAPRGTVGLGEVRGAEDGPRISIYATAATSKYPGGFPAVARWFEFGTAERFRKVRGGSGGRTRVVGKAGSTGAIDAQPYFFPTYRANRARVRARIRARIRKEAAAL